jgi:hypothetical protein
MEIKNKVDRDSRPERRLCEDAGGSNIASRRRLWALWTCKESEGMVRQSKKVIISLEMCGTDEERLLDNRSVFCEVGETQQR